MSPKRLRKIALYLKYIAFVLEEEAKTEEIKHDTRRSTKTRKKVRRPMEAESDRS